MQMKSALVVLLLATGPLAVFSNTIPGNALNKVMELLSNVEDKVKKESAREAELNENKLNYCTETTTEASNALRRAKLEEGETAATVAAAQADIDEYNEKKNAVIVSLVKNQKDLQETVEARKAEAKEFKLAQAELSDSIETMGRAIALIAKEMRKNPAALAQVNTTTLAMLLQSFDTMTDAISLPSKDKKHLLALLQSFQGDSDDQLGAPSVANYKSSSGSIMDILENMKEKAEVDLSKLQKNEMEQRHNSVMLKSQLEADLKADDAEKGDLTQAISEKEQVKAEAQGEVNKYKTESDTQTKVLEETEQGCNTWKLDYAKFQKDQSAELQALSEARKAVTAAIGNVDLQVSSASSDSTDSDSTSFLQMDEATSGNMKVVEMVRDLARKDHSTALMQLASRIKTLIRYGSDDGESPFAKVTQLVRQMIDKLETQLSQERLLMDSCDKEMASVEERKRDLNKDIGNLRIKHEKSANREVSMADNHRELLAEIAANDKEWADMQQIMQTETEQFTKTDEELRASLQATEKAISILREFYSIPEPGERPIEIPKVKTWVADLQVGGCATTKFDCCLDGQTAKNDEEGTNCEENQPESVGFLQVHTKASQHSKSDEQKNTIAASGIVEILTVIRDDLSKTLTQANRDYEDSKRILKKKGQLFEVEKTKKNVDVRYYSSMGTKATSETSELKYELDGKTAQKEAVVEEYEKLKERCTTKPLEYAERKARREREIKGLKEALIIIQDETAEAAFVQQRPNIRGFHSHAA